MKLAYYPGCSLTSSASAYDISVRMVCDKLGIELVEIDDWNCCGATEAATLNLIASHALVARNLARVDEAEKEVVAPCAACYLNLRKTDAIMQEDKTLCSQINTALEAGELHYDPGQLKIRHLLDVFANEVGNDALADAVKKPLSNLRVAPYYGCQIVRPTSDVDDPEHPTKMDDLLRAMGATVVDFPLKTHCCGGHMTQISDDLSNELIRRLLYNAASYRADVIVCLCPMCQLNLDAYQSRVNRAFKTEYAIPIVYLTQLIGLALGVAADDLGFGKEIVPAGEIIERRLAEEPAAATKKKPRRKRGTTSLPIPGRDFGEGSHG